MKNTMLVGQINPIRVPMDQPIDMTKLLNHFTNKEICAEVCFGRTCRDCPLRFSGGGCRSLSRDVLIDAYCTVFRINNSDIGFEVTENEWKDLVQP